MSGTPLSGAPGSDQQFGAAVAVEGDILAVGESHDTGAEIGAVVIFERAGGAWTETDRLTPSDATSRRFGAVLSMDAGTLAASSTSASDRPGQVHVYTWSGTAFALQQIVTPTDSTTSDAFGADHDLSGDTLAVSGRNAVYLFERSAGTWTQAQKIDATAVVPRVALEGDTLVVSERDTGVTFFTRGSPDWTVEEAFVSSADFGAVALSGDFAVVGRDGSSLSRLRPFDRTSGSWMERPELLTGPSLAAVAMDGDFLVTGQVELIGSRSSLRRLWQRDGTTWVQGWSDGGNADHVAIHGGTFAVGDPRANDWEGSATVYAFTGSAYGFACATAADCASGFCVDGVCCDSECAQTCEVCSVAAGATTEGICRSTRGLDRGGCCETDSQCDDDNGCTMDECVDNVCVNTERCDDGNPCTRDYCSALRCRYEVVDASCEPPDGGTGPTDDGGARGVDAAVGGDPRPRSDGCGCRVATDTGPAPGLLPGLLLLMLCAALGLRRRGRGRGTGGNPGGGNRPTYGCPGGNRPTYG